jgi:hypothetical protein
VSGGDLVDRLREIPNFNTGTLAHEAADLIDRLTRELAEANARAVPDGLRRYVECRAKLPIRGMDDVIHAIHTGTEYEAELRLSDLRAVISVRPDSKESCNVE